MVVLIAGVVKLVDALDSKSSFLREVSVRARPSVQSQNPLRNCWGFFFALNRFGATWLTTLIHHYGYFSMDTVVGTIEGVRHTIPYQHIFIPHSLLKPNNYEMTIGRCDRSILR